jgi:succinate dehydrogenase / fumarate reductase membrane anchor subunit
MGCVGFDFIICPLVGFSLIWGEHMSFGGKGIRDWIFQRVTAVFLAGYTFFLLYFWLAHPTLAADQWQGLFSGLCMRLATFLALVALLIHVWIGMWTILTDYVHAYCIRIILLSVVGFSLLGYLGWGLYILWG